MAEVKNSLQKQFDDAFGSGRVEVKWENNKLEFKTTKLAVEKIRVPH